MPKISVFTPSHDPRWLDQCYESLKAQSFHDWEWVILLNGGAEWDPNPDELLDDPRVVVTDVDPAVTTIGELKAMAVHACSGDLLVELDHDDILVPEALEILALALETYPDNRSLFYSNTMQINEDGTPNFDRFDVRHGWQYHGDTVVGVEGTLHGIITTAMRDTPHNVSNIWYAPNHVRAFPRWAYRQAGGYDPNLEVCDDLDLMCRLYQLAPFEWLPMTLYLQRVHPENTQLHKNALIQSESLRLYDHYVEPNVLEWARRNGLSALDLGGAHNPRTGYLTVDKHGGDYTGDVFDVLGNMADSSAGVIRAADFLEHIIDKVELMNEIHRVLAPDGMFLSITPSSDGRGAFQDPTHVSYWNENSFWYYTDKDYAKYVPEITCRFQVSRIVSYFPSDWHREHDIPYVCANLIALKSGGFRNGGILAW